jgi:colanic acid biosynthesis glycosyl transferase WcaI
MTDQNRKMKIIVWGINYAPETAGIPPQTKNLCDYLSQAGHELKVVTGFPYYPSWKKREQDQGVLYRRDEIDGVPVYRCWQYVPRKVTSLKRMIHEASFVGTSFCRMLFLPTPDVYVVKSPPLLLGTAAWLLTCFKKAPFVFHVHDLQPDAALGLGMLKKGMFARILYGLENFAYRKAARVTGISKSILEAFRQKGVPESKIVHYADSTRFPKTGEEPRRGEFRRREGYGEDDFLVIYAGNLGVKQGLEVLLEATALIQNPNIKVVICGDGARREALEEEARKKQLKNFKMLPFQVGEGYRELLIDTDLSVITQLPGSGGFFVPSKLLDTLVYRKPVLSVADSASELYHAVEEGKCGRNIPPGDPLLLARAIEEAYDQRDSLIQMGESGRQFVERFETNRVQAGFEKVLRQLLASD